MIRLITIAGIHNAETASISYAQNTLMRAESLSENIHRVLSESGQYLYMDGSSWKTLPGNGIVTIGGKDVLKIETDSNGQETYIAFEEDGTYRLHADGSIEKGTYANGTFTKSAEEAVTSVGAKLTGRTTIYLVSRIIAGKNGNVTIRVEEDNTDCQAYIEDGNDTGSKEVLNIKAGLNLLVYMSGTGHFGLDTDPLEIELGGLVIFHEAKGTDIVFGVDASLESDSITFDSSTKVTDGAVVTMTTTNGSFVAPSLTVEKGGQVTVTTTKGDVVLENLTIDGKIPTADGTTSSAVINADGDARIDEIGVTNGGYLELTAAGDLSGKTSGTGTEITVSGTGSSLDMDVTGSANVTDISASGTGTGHTNNVQIGGSLNASGDISADNSNMTITTGGAATIGGDVSSMDNSTLSITAQRGNMTVGGYVTADGNKALNLNAAAGSFSVNGETKTEDGKTTESITVTNDGKASIQAGQNVTVKDIDMTGNQLDTNADLDITAGKNLEVGYVDMHSSEFQAKASGYARIFKQVELDSSKLTFDVTGALTMDKHLSLTNGSTLTLKGNADTTINLDQETLEGSELSVVGSNLIINRTGALTVYGETTLNGGTTDIDVTGNILFTGAMDVKNGHIANITTTGGSFTAPSASADNSTLTIQAASDVELTNSLTASNGAAVTITADGADADGIGFTTKQLSVTGASTVSVDAYGKILVSEQTVIVTGTDAAQAVLNLTSRNGDVELTKGIAASKADVTIDAKQNITSAQDQTWTASSSNFNVTAGQNILIDHLIGRNSITNFNARNGVFTTKDILMENTGGTIQAAGDMTIRNSDSKDKKYVLDITGRTTEILRLISHNGSIRSDATGNSWRLTDGAQLEATAKVDVIIAQTLSMTGSTAAITAQTGEFVLVDDVTADGDDGEADCTVESSKLTVSASAGIHVSHVSATGSTVTFTTTVEGTEGTGGYTGKTLSTDSSTVSILVQDDVILRNEENDNGLVLNMNDSDVTIRSAIGGLYSDTKGDSWKIVDSKLHASVYEDVRIARQVYIDPSEVTIISATGGLVTKELTEVGTDNWCSQESGVTVKVAGDIEIRRLTILNSIVEMSSLISGETGAAQRPVEAVDTGIYNIYYAGNTIYYRQGDKFFTLIGTAMVETQDVDFSRLVAAKDGVEYKLTALKGGVSYQVFVDGNGNPCYLSGEKWYVFQAQVYSLESQVLSASQKKLCKPLGEGAYTVYWNSADLKDQSLYVKRGDEMFRVEDGRLVPVADSGLTLLNKDSTPYTIQTDETGSTVYLVNSEGGYFQFTVTQNSLSRTEAPAVSDGNRCDTAITGGGGYTGKYLYADNSRLTLDVWGSIVIVNDENDGAVLDPATENVVIIRNSDETDKLATEILRNGVAVEAFKGVTLRSRTGSFNASETRDFDLYKDESGNLYLKRDDSYYTYTTSTGSLTTGKGTLALATPEGKLTLLTDGEGYQVFDFTNDDVNHKAYFAKDHRYYLYNPETGKLEEDTTLELVDRLDMEDIGITNRFDSLNAYKSTLNIDVYDDIDIRHHVVLEENSVGRFSSAAGELTNADYWYDVDGNGINDARGITEWKLKNSAMVLNIHSNIRIDHLSVSLSNAVLDTEDGGIVSKTWYFYGSRVAMETAKALNVKYDDGGNKPVPAVWITACNDDLYFFDADSKEMMNAIVDLNVGFENGKLIEGAANAYLKFQTGVSNIEYDNSLDCFVTASTVLMDVSGTVDIRETVVNAENWNVNGSTEGEKKDDTVNDEKLYFDAEGRDSVTAERYNQEERAYGTEMQIRSWGADFIGENWQISGARLGEKNDGTLSTAKGVSDVLITAKEDVTFRYNLHDWIDETLAQYGMIGLIAPRELTILDASQVQIASIDGEVTYEYDRGTYGSPNYTRTDVLVQGDTQTNTRAKFVTVAGGRLVLPVLETKLADVSVRSVLSDVLFDEVTAEKTNLRLDAEGSLKIYHPIADGVQTGPENDVRHNSINFKDKPNGEIDPTVADSDTKDNSSLVLRAGGNIGAPDCWLYLNVPEDLTVIVEQVNDLFLDVQKRSEEGKTLSETDMREYLITQGYDPAMASAVAAYLIGGVRGTDYLNYSDEQFFAVLLGLNSQKAILDWIRDRSEAVYTKFAGREWLNNVEDLDASIRTVLAGSTSEQEKVLNALFGREIADRFIQERRKTGKTYEQLLYTARPAPPTPLWVRGPQADG